MYTGSENRFGKYNTFLLRQKDKYCRKQVISAATKVATLKIVLKRG